MKKYLKSVYITLGVLSVPGLWPTTSMAQHNFVTINGHDFVRVGQQYRYIGANYWYGGLLSSTKGDAGKKRLRAELDFLKEQGVINLRVLVGAEGISRYPLPCCRSIAARTRHVRRPTAHRP